MSSTTKGTHGARWLSVQSAADLLGMPVAALRKSLSRRARRAADGGIEAELDGVRARKLGRLWRVTLSAAWTQPQLAAPTNVALDREGHRS